MQGCTPNRSLYYPIVCTLSVMLWAFCHDIVQVKCLWVLLLLFSILSVSECFIPLNTLAIVLHLMVNGGTLLTSSMKRKQILLANQQLRIIRGDQTSTNWRVPGIRWAIKVWCRTDHDPHWCSRWGIRYQCPKRYFVMFTLISIPKCRSVLWKPGREDKIYLATGTARCSLVFHLYNIHANSRCEQQPESLDVANMPCARWRVK